MGKLFSRGRFTKAFLAAMMVFVLVVLAACGDEGGGAGAGDELRLAMVLPGPVEDADYNFVGYRALEDLKAQYGIDTRYQEQVAPADAERVARGFINDGFNVIAFHGGQFVTAAQKLAPEFPEVNFVMESAGELPDLPDNVWNIGRKFYEGFYPLGTLAAHATKTNKVGVLLGIRLPDFVASINSIQQAIREENPDVEIIHTWVGDQNDPIKARQAAEAMIDDGVDFIILVVNLGAHGVIEAARDKDVLITTYYTDKHSMAPDNFAASLLLDFAVPYGHVIERIMEGERHGYVEQRPGNGMSLSELTHVPDDVAEKVKGIFEQVAGRQLDIPEIDDEVQD